MVKSETNSVESEAKDKIYRQAGNKVLRERSYRNVC